MFMKAFSPQIDELDDQVEEEDQNKPFTSIPSLQSNCEKLRNKQNENFIGFESIQKLLDIQNGYQKPKKEEQIPISKFNNQEKRIIISGKELERPKRQIRYRSPELIQKQIITNKEIEEPQQLVWIQKRPYSRLVNTFEQKVIKVPVQKIQKSQYEVKHVVNYIKREITQIKPELQKRVYIDYKLDKYIPVDKQIIHLPTDLLNQRTRRQSSTKNQKTTTYNHTFGKPFLLQQNHSRNLTSNKPKTYFVTSPGYDYQLQEKRWQIIMSEMTRLNQIQQQIDLNH